MKVKGSLKEDIKTDQLKCFGHVIRSREDRLLKKIFEWQPMGRRKRELPNITWTEGIRTQDNEGERITGGKPGG
ncbi:hypothetical protein C0J52_27776 [Blattella germanica]|nr:hypothetical protein C0J52_27776 [Blattella germanica]